MTGATNILGFANPLEHVADVPWRIAGRDLPWMSSQIGVMIIAALILLIGMPLLARRRVATASGHSMGLIELIVLFVRGQIARPTVGDLADQATPFLATLFMFLLLCNLLGLVPMMDVSNAVGLSGYGGTGADGEPRFVTPVGGTPTAGLWVCAAFAGIIFGVVMLGSYWRQVRRLRKGHSAAVESHQKPGRAAGWNLWMRVADWIQRRSWPLPLAMILGIWTWLNSFVPPIAGVVGLVVWPALLMIEMIGYVTKCFALCVRLLANMNSGHVLLVVLLIFAETARGWMIIGVSLPTGIGLVALMGLELLVSVIQAYIFTFLSALFIALAMSPHH